MQGGRKRVKGKETDAPRGNALRAA